MGTEKINNKSFLLQFEERVTAQETASRGARRCDAIKSPLDLSQESEHMCHHFHLQKTNVKARDKKRKSIAPRPQPSVRNKRRATDCSQVKHSAKATRVGSASAHVPAHLPGDAAFGGTGDANYDANSGCHKECGAGDARVMLPLGAWRFRSWCRC